jgi:hypothetical protein
MWRDRSHAGELRQRDKPASAATTHDEQSHVVGWWTGTAKPRDIPQDAVSHGFRALPKMMPERTDQAFFFVVITPGILRLRDAVGIQDETLAGTEAEMLHRVLTAAE